MIDPNDPLVQLKTTCATCSLFALGSTIYRLYKRRGRYWADDAWALVAFLALIVQVVAVFLHVPTPNEMTRTARVAGGCILPRQSGSPYYLMAMTFYTIIWASRLSILFSIVRVDPSEQRRRTLGWVALAFVGAATFLHAQLLWVCEPEPAWKDAANPQCRLPLQVALCQVVTDVIADTVLLLAPVPLFRQLADRALRRKLTLIFSTCVVTTVVSLVHASFILRNGGIKVLITALVEDCMSLVVANLPVVVTALVDITSADRGRPASSLRFSTTPWFNGGAHTATDGTGLGTVDGDAGTLAWKLAGGRPQKTRTAPGQADSGSG
ncbi:hypothetical protein B0H15DRAFT_793969 [Mycena belliarum]|uniref:Rhodopsin domain-containing protein n=1 Tax=Mycena belliarum TaxID=1033014 RepID=A0AAD6TMF5_9AGAR|nr:hypothetical protein B0H15DRAFT_793969 [Mycena belliae]